MEDIIIKVLLMLLGLSCHFLKAFVQIKKATGKNVSPQEYFIDNKWHTFLALAGASAGFLLLMGTAELTKAVAFGLGYMADSVADTLGQRSKKAIDGN